MYIIQSGEIEQVIDCIPPFITVFKKGDVFGEVSVSDKKILTKKNLWPYFFIFCTSTILAIRLAS